MANIGDYIRDLNSDNEKKRAFAAGDIAYDGLQEGIVPLVKRLQIESSRFVKEAIVNALKSMNGIEVVNNVIPLLRSDDAFIRNAGIEILSSQGENAIEPIRNLICDPDKDVRKFAIDVAIQIDNGYGPGLIAEALDDSDINIIITAVEYLGKLEAYEHTPRINEILRKTSNILLRCTCLEALAFIGNKDSVAAVSAIYSDRQQISPLEIYSYLKFLACQGTQTDLNLIINLMQENDFRLHKEIINALQGILRRSELEKLDGEILAVLFNYLESGINDINKYQLLVLSGNYKNDEIFPVLLKYAQMDNLLLCQGAVEGLGLYGRTEALGLLSELKPKVTDEELLEAIERSWEQLHR